MAERFDFIVVGAGSAGCALARRLSDDQSVAVALVEAGGSDERPEIADPTKYFKLWGSEIDWDYTSTPQPGTLNRTHRLPRGKVLGGTSSLNGMVYLRGAQSDFDAWETGGCTGWGWAAVETSYSALEKLLQPAVLADTNELSAVFIKAAVESGHAYNPSFDSGTLKGCGWNRSTIHQGRRHSSYRAFIHPVIDRSNLTLFTNTQVQRLIISSSGAVTGVRCHGDSGQIVSLLASEVILCAGAYESPRLLLASGVGSFAELGKHGISAIVDLPVGDNLQDHLLTGIVYTSPRPISQLHSSLTECCVFAPSSLSHNTCDIEISFAKEPLFAPDMDETVAGYTIIPGVTRLGSRGSVRLAPRQSKQRVVIDHAYFSDPADMGVMIEAVRLSRDIGEADAFDDWREAEYFPGPHVESDEEIAQYIRKYVSTWFHPAGTCKMGSGEDAVVGPDLRVRGTTGLRVADASVMPSIVTVNTNAAATMIGWRAADMIYA